MTKANYRSRQLSDNCQAGFMRFLFDRRGYVGVFVAGTNGSANGFNLHASGRF